MLPKFLQSALKTYKEDTNAIATWLAVTAKQCGCPSDLVDGNDEPTSSASQSTQSSKRLKGNARKKAKNAANKQSENGPDGSENGTGARYIIKIRQFITLAEFIVACEKPVVKVPQSLANALNRAIDLRKDHNDWSKGQESSDKPIRDANDANESHSFFLNVLQQTRDILKPRIPSSLLDDFLSKPCGDHERQKFKELSNQFAQLEVQEPSQAFVDAPDVVSEPKSSPEPRYEAEPVKTMEEEYLAVHGLLQDIRNIRSCVRQLWGNYLQGMDIAAISITTNTAIDLVRNLEREFRLQFPDKSDYKDIVELFYKVQCLNQGQDPGHTQQTGDPFNLAVYDLAQECLISTYTILASVRNVVKPGVVPIYRPGHFGHRNLRSEWSSKSPREKYQDDKLVLLEAIPDLMMMTMITAKSPLAEDELLRGFRDMAPGKDIPIWLVFAAQCFLDAQHVLKQDVSRPHGELLNTANAIRASVKQNLDFHESLRIENWPRTNDFRFSETLRVIEEWVRRDVVAERLRKIQRKMPVPGPEPFRLLKQYPLLCGLFMFAIRMQYQELSIDFANAWGSVLFTGHLYNAVRQEKLLHKGWKDMELVITMQSPERMFVGGAPKGLEEYLKRFLLGLGYSATNFASNRRRGATAPSIRGPRSLAKLGKIAELFTGRYCKNDQTVSWTQESMAPIFEAKLDDDSDNEGTKPDSSAQPNDKSAEKKAAKVKQSSSGALLNKPKGNVTTVPTVKFLADLANSLHAETLELSIDYLCLHRHCWVLLRLINDACKPKLLELYGPGYLSKEHQLPFVIGYIFMTATATSQVTNLLLPRRKEGEISSRLLATAAQYIQAMIDGGNGAYMIKMLEQLLGLELDMGQMDDMDEADQSELPKT